MCQGRYHHQMHAGSCSDHIPDHKYSSLHQTVITLLPTNSSLNAHSTSDKLVMHAWPLCPNYAARFISCKCHLHYHCLLHRQHSQHYLCHAGSVVKKIVSKRKKEAHCQVQQSLSGFACCSLTILEHCPHQDVALKAHPYCDLLPSGLVGKTEGRTST